MSSRWPLGVVVAIHVLLCSVFCRDARAEARRVLFVAERSTAFSERLRAEVEAMGFEIVRGESLDGPAPFAVVAAVRVVETPLPRRVELWLANDGNAPLTLSTVVEPSANDDQTSQAVRASEQLRAFLQPLREQTDAPVAVPNAPAAAPGPTPPAPVWSDTRALLPAPIAPRAAPARRFTAGAALAVPFEPGGPGFDVLLHGRLRLSSRFAVGAVLDVPAVSATVRSSVNSASLSASLLDAEFAVILFDSRALELSASAGVGVVWLRTKGDATAPYTSKVDDAAVALPLLGFEMAPRLSERVRVRVGMRVGIAVPKSDIAFADERVATWGRPLALASAGLSYDF
jgi:hypothetical protein